jgi:hypothetical protein
MGCDGGTIPRRNELVKVKQKPETKDHTSHLIFQWRYCNITQQLLQRPIVTCGLGRLYNKSAIIEAIIGKVSMPSHIKTLKDTVELNLHPNPEFCEGSTTQVDVSPYICPVTGLEMSGNFRFVALWSCGCVFSERALKETKMKTCLKCQTGFEDVDVVVLNATTEDDVKSMTTRMDARRKNKKRSVKEGVVKCKKVKVG